MTTRDATIAAARIRAAQYEEAHFDADSSATFCGVFVPERLWHLVGILSDDGLEASDFVGLKAVIKRHPHMSLALLEDHLRTRVLPANRTVDTTEIKRMRTLIQLIDDSVPPPLPDSARTQQIHDIVVALTDEYIAAGHAKTAKDINAGLCESFAIDLLQRVEQEIGICNGQDIGIANFLAEDPATGLASEGGPFDRSLIAEHWPGFLPPEGFDWEDMDRLSHDANFDAGTHVWAYVNGLHFDAEMPDGVLSPFDLPFFQRVIASWDDEVRRRPGV